MSLVLGCQVTSVTSYREIHSEGWAAVTHPYTLIKAPFWLVLGLKSRPFFPTGDPSHLPTVLSHQPMVRQLVLEGKERNPHQRRRSPAELGMWFPVSLDSQGTLPPHLRWHLITQITLGSQGWKGIKKSSPSFTSGRVTEAMHTETEASLLQASSGGISWTSQLRNMAGDLYHN